jgi:predicted RNA-binding Zn-ribbon protein involved in translation (DUF1610 family)
MASSKNKKIPESGEVKFVIKEILQKAPAGSQAEMTRLVLKKLKAVEGLYSISGRRIRELALEIPVRVQVQTMHGKVPKKCPSCGRRLRKTYSKNLFGRKMLFRMSCPHCGYSGIEGKWLPRRYRFSLR